MSDHDRENPTAETPDRKRRKLQVNDLDAEGADVKGGRDSTATEGGGGEGGCTDARSGTGAGGGA